MRSGGDETDSQVWAHSFGKGTRICKCGFAACDLKSDGVLEGEAETGS